MDVQKIFDNYLNAEREERMKTSEQLMLCELIMKLDHIQDKRLLIVFNPQLWPVGVDSWRGSYRELAIEYSDEGDIMSVADFLEILKGAVGKEFVGYKGGNYVMGKNTPVWVANYGNMHGFKRNDNGDCHAVVGVQLWENKVIIETELIPF